MNIEEYTIEMEKNLIPYKDYICPETIFGIYNSEEKNKIWKYGQAGVIKIGNAVERVINILLTTNGYRELDNKVVCKDGRNRRIDFLGIKNDEILILESKLKDNHDTGKSMDSIISDLVIKIEGVRNNYPNYKIIAILGFVLPNEKLPEMSADQQSSQRLVRPSNLIW